VKAHCMSMLQCNISQKRGIVKWLARYICLIENQTVAAPGLPSGRNAPARILAVALGLLPELLSN
jgi:hypothetical protein